MLHRPKHGSESATPSQAADAELEVMLRDIQTKEAKYNLLGFRFCMRDWNEDLTSLQIASEVQEALDKTIALSKQVLSRLNERTR